MDFGIPDDGSRWFACRTRGRSEKAVHGRLGRAGFRSYLPVIEKKRRWADRTKRVEFPLFPGYVFVQFPWYRVGEVLATPSLVDVVRLGGTPSPIRMEELESIHVLVQGSRETGKPPAPADYLQPGDPVRVVEGPFRGMEGVLIEVRGRERVAVRLPAIRQAVAVDLKRDCLSIATAG